MIPSTNTGWNLDRTGIIRNAFQMIGVVRPGQDPNSAQLTMGTDFLTTILLGLQTRGIQLCRVVETTDTLVAGQATYTCASNTIDIDEHNPYVTQGTGAQRVDMPLKKISRGEYMSLTIKQSQTQPSQFYVNKGETAVTYSLYPTPDSTWTSITYPRIVIQTDMDNGAVSTGLPTRYLEVVVMMLAAKLAFPHGLLPQQRALQKQADELLEEVNNDDTERGPVSFRPSYGIRFGGRW